MNYIRTDKIKNKQSLSMKKKHEDDPYDWEKIEKKRKLTYKERDTKPGRKPGCGNARQGEMRPCPVCNTPVYYKPQHIREDKRKCCSRKCLMIDPVYRQKLSKVDRSYLQTEEHRAKLRKPSTKAYRSYRNNVNILTERNYVEYIEVINPQRHPRTIAGVEGGWQLDHIKTVRECFDAGVYPEIASEVSNLRMLPWQENLARNKKCCALKN